MWSRDGREIDYRQGTDMMVVEVALGDELRPGAPRVVFAGDFALDNSGHQSFDVAPDGESFVMHRIERVPLTEIRVILNWASELERLAVED